MSTQNISKKEKAPLTEAIYQTEKGNNKITDLNYTSEKEKSQELYIELSDNTDKLEFILDSLVILHEYVDRGRVGRGSQEGSLLCILLEKLDQAIEVNKGVAQLLHEN